MFEDGIEGPPLVVVPDGSNTDLRRGVHGLKAEDAHGLFKGEERAPRTVRHLDHIALENGRGEVVVVDLEKGPELHEALGHL